MMPELNSRKDASLALRCIFPRDAVDLREDKAIGVKHLYINAETEPRFSAPTWVEIYDRALDALVASRVAEHLRHLQELQAQ